MSELFGRWPLSVPPWEVTPYYGSTKTTSITGPVAGAEVLAGDPNRVAVWVTLIAGVAPGNVVVNVAALSGGDEINILDQNMALNAGSPQLFYFWYARHGPVVQGRWRATIPNPDTIQVSTMILNSWPERAKEFTPIKVPKCPTLSIANPLTTV